MSCGYGTHVYNSSGCLSGCPAGSTGASYSLDFIIKQVEAMNKLNHTVEDLSWKAKIKDIQDNLQKLKASLSSADIDTDLLNEVKTQCLEALKQVQAISTSMAELLEREHLETRKFEEDKLVGYTGEITIDGTTYTISHGLIKGVKS